LGAATLSTPIAMIAFCKMMRAGSQTEEIERPVTAELIRALPT